jgi:hypothetical protein
VRESRRRPHGAGRWGRAFLRSRWADVGGRSLLRLGFVVGTLDIKPEVVRRVLEWGSVCGGDKRLVPLQLAREGGSGGEEGVRMSPHWEV